MKKRLGPEGIFTIIQGIHTMDGLEPIDFETMTLS